MPNGEAAVDAATGNLKPPGVDITETVVAGVALRLAVDTKPVSGALREPKMFLGCDRLVARPKGFDLTGVV